MKITVIGGGNIGTQFAVHSAEKGHDVIMYTSAPEVFSTHLSIVDRDGKLTHEGDIVKATKDPEEAFRNADMIMITMPPTMMIPLAELIYEHTDSHTMIGFVPGNGGFELVFKKCIDRGNVFFGIDRVPAIARLTEKGRTVCCSGYKDKLFVGAIPAAMTETCAALIESIYDIECVRLPGFMALTLTPSNPILHTARLKTIFKDYKPGVSYDSIPLFYEEWDDESSELLMACDDEIQAICRALPDFGLEYVVSEREFYNSNTPEEMTRAISTEESLLGLTTPSATSGGRLIPDLHSRYFTADFPYGLTVIHQIGKLAGVDMPNIEGLLDWYDAIAIENNKLLLSDYGINNMEELRAFYLQ